MHNFTHWEMATATTQHQIDTMLAHGSQVLEFGAGWSTYLFAKAGATVTTVDNGVGASVAREICAGYPVTVVFKDATAYVPEFVPDVIFIDFGFDYPKFTQRRELAARVSELAPTYVHDIDGMNVLTKIS